MILSLVLGQSFNVRAEVRQSTIDYLNNAEANVWVTQALKAAGQNNLNLDYLNDFQGSYANDFSRTILAVVAAGQEPYNFNNQNLVSGLLSFYMDGQIGSVNLLNDDIWGILALISAGEANDSQAVFGTKQYLLGAQNQDGGWGFSTEVVSDTNDTASAVMALLSAGVPAADSAIVDALSYLHQAQNTDGGLGFYPDSQSDSGSTAWTVSALISAGQNPSSWLINDQTPITFLESLALADGSYKWLPTDVSGSLLMTTYVAVALANQSYPVSYYQNQNPPVNTRHLRIEGPDQTICDVAVEANTALEMVINGAEICGYEYHIQDTAFGPYLDMIGNVAAGPETGWQYWVNWQSPAIGAADYQLNNDDYVLWGFGGFTIHPLKITLSAAQVQPNQPVSVTVEFYNNQIWQPAAQAEVRANNRIYPVDNNGQTQITLTDNGLYQVYGEKEDYVRSQKAELTVGSGMGQFVTLSVNIDNQQVVPPVDRLAFILNTDSLDFGTLKPGDQASRNVQLTNSGNVSVYLESVVNGDRLFVDNLRIANANWEDYQDMVPVNNYRQLDVSLNVPNNYDGAGNKQANLIFWASRGE